MGWERQVWDDTVDDLIRHGAHVEGRPASLAQTLYTVESNERLAFFRSQKDVEVDSGGMAFHLTQVLDDVGISYPVVRNAIEQIASSVGAVRSDDAQRLLRRDAIALQTGAAIGAVNLLVALKEQLDQMAKGTARLAHRVRQALVSLDPKPAALAELVKKGSSLAGHDVEVREAQSIWIVPWPSEAPSRRRPCQSR